MRQFPSFGRRITVRTLACIAAVVFVAGCGEADRSEDVAQLLALREQILAAHRSGDVEGWLALETDEMISANNGTITFPTRAERRAMREPYLTSTTFTAYRDLRPPLVAVSDDGTLGWVIVEVEIRGTQPDSVGGERAIDSEWAWIELYRKIDGDWRLVGNVSNRKP